MNAAIKGLAGAAAVIVPTAVVIGGYQLGKGSAEDQLAAGGNATDIHERSGAHSYISMTLAGIGAASGGSLAYMAHTGELSSLAGGAGWAVLGVSLLAAGYAAHQMGVFNNTD